MKIDTHTNGQQNRQMNRQKYNKKNITKWQFDKKTHRELQKKVGIRVKNKHVQQQNTRKCNE